MQKEYDDAFEKFDYKIAMLVETITRASVERGAPPALKHYAELLGVSERNVYKLLQRARRLGFTFGLSINYDRIDMRLAMIVSDAPLASNVPPRGVAKLLDGRYLQTYYVPKGCEGEIAGRVGEDRVYFATIVWGSRPALASIPYNYMSLDVEPREELLGAMRRVFESVYENGLPDISGRRYPADKVTVLILNELDYDAMRSVSSIAASFGLSPVKIQRKYYRLWRRKAIVGYRVRRTPYCESTGVVAVVRHRDPERFAYALPVLPPIASAAVAYRPGSERPLTIVQTMGGGAVTHAVMRLLRDLGGKIEVMYAYTSPRRGPRSHFERAYKAPIGAPLECPKIKPV